MKRQWKGRTRGGPFGYLFFIWLVRTAGLGAAYAFLGLVVVYFIVAAPSQTRSVWVYSRRILLMAICVRPDSFSVHIMRSASQ